MSTKSADWASARTLCPVEDYRSSQWREHYRANPDVLTTMLGDIYRVFKSEEAKRNGTSNPQGGRRKAHIDGNLEELWQIITPRFSVAPFACALEEVRAGRSYGQIAARAGMDRRRLSGLRAGKETTVLSRADLEAVAHAVDVHPAFFVEWRLMAIQDLLAEVFTTSPHLSIMALKGLSR